MVYLTRIRPNLVGDTEPLQRALWQVELNAPQVELPESE